MLVKTLRNYSIITICGVFLSLSLNAQDSLPRIVKDTLFSTTGFRIVKGDKLKMGVGTMPDGSFKYVRINANSLFAYYSGTPNAANSANAGQRGISGYEYKVVRLEPRGNKKYGFVNYAILATGGAKYEVDVDNAIATGEIVVPVEFRPKIASASTGAPASTLADELKKLKDLLDSGAINKEEYDAAKKKILNQ